MGQREFYDGLKGRQAADQEFADGLAFFAGLTKEACDFSIDSGGSKMQWVHQFDGTPLSSQAVDLERQELQLEADSLTRRQQENTERQQEDSERQARYQQEDAIRAQRDQIRLQKKELELQLVEQQNGQQEAPAQPEMPEMLAEPQTAPEQAAPIEPPAQQMPKLAGLSTVAKSRLAGGALGLASSGANISLHNLDQERLPKKEQKPIGKGLGAALLAGGTGGGAILGHHLGKLRETTDLYRKALKVRNAKNSATAFKASLPARKFIDLPASAVKDLPKKKLAYEIKPADRPNIPHSDFAQPKKEEAGHKGKYPIPDRQHARSALGFAKMHGDTAAYAAVKAKIQKKFPDMLGGKEKDAGPDSFDQNTSSMQDPAAPRIDPAAALKTAGVGQWTARNAKKLYGAGKDLAKDPYHLMLTLGSGTVGGVVGSNTFRPKKRHGGESNFEVDSKKDLLAQQAAGSDESGMGLSKKLRRRLTEVKPGIAKALREHPIQSALLGAAAGAATGYKGGKLLFKKHAVKGVHS